MQHEYTYVLSRKGRFNLLDPSKESISTHIAIMNPDGSKKMYCNITTDDIIDNDCDLIQELTDYLKRYWGNTEDAKKVKQYLIENEEQLFYGNLQQELIKLNKEELKIESRISEIKNILNNKAHFEKGVWIE